MFGEKVAFKSSLLNYPILLDKKSWVGKGLSRISVKYLIFYL